MSTEAYTTPMNESNMIKDDELFEIVQKIKPEKLEVVQNFGQPGNCNTTIKEVAWALKHCNVPEEQAHDWLTDRYQQQYPNTAEHDIAHAMNGIYTGDIGKPCDNGFRFPAIKKIEVGTAKKLAADLGIKPTSQLISSPDPLPTNEIEYINGLFANTPESEPLIYIGDRYSGRIMPLTVWNVADFENGKVVLTGRNNNSKHGSPDQIITNRMERLHDGTTNSGGRNKAHCIEIPEVLTFEMDGVDKDIQIGTINFLAKRLPLVSVVDSGNASLHATFSVLRLSEELLKKVFVLMHQLGADPAVLRPHQLSRLGCANRLPKEGKLIKKKDGAFQACIFMDSKARARKPNPQEVDKTVKKADSILSRESNDEQITGSYKLYFLQSKMRYILVDEAGYHNLLIGRLKSHLRKLGLGDDADIENVIVNAEKHSKVSFCGPLAGIPEGHYYRKGVSYLCDQGPILIEPVKGDWSTIRDWMNAMFAPDVWNSEVGDYQLNTVMGWLKVGAEALRNNTFQVGQLLALAGASGSGKSLFQSLIITPMLGGRSANPFKYLSGGTDFNANLYGAEHLTLDDEALSKKTVGRVEFGQKLKGLLVAGDSGDFLHAKGLDGVNIRVQQRVSMSLNDDEADLAVLPPLSQRSIADKISLIRCACDSIPMPTSSNAEFDALKAQIAVEIPAFLYYLLHEYEIPVEVMNDRYGVASYKNPDLAEAIHDVADESQLELFIDEVLFRRSSVTEWSGTTHELTEALSYDWNKSCCRQAKELLSSHRRKADSLLTILHRNSPGRYSVAKGASNRRVWTIKRSSKY